jgi:hypothetical protein
MLMTGSILAGSLASFNKAAKMLPIVSMTSKYYSSAGLPVQCHAHAAHEPAGRHLGT